MLWKDDLGYIHQPVAFHLLSYGIHLASLNMSFCHSNYSRLSSYIYYLRLPHRRHCVRSHLHKFHFSREKHMVNIGKGDHQPAHLKSYNTPSLLKCPTVSNAVQMIHNYSIFLFHWKCQVKKRASFLSPVASHILSACVITSAEHQTWGVRR